MKNKKFESVSASSVKIQPSAKVKVISPKSSPHKTMGMVLDRAEVLKIGRNLIMVASDTDTEGDVVMTVHRNAKRLSVFAYKGYVRKAALK